MTLHMLQMAPDLPGILRWAVAKRLVDAKKTDDLGYALHTLLTAGFGTLAPRPWALPITPQRTAQLLAYGTADAAALAEHAAAFADPLLCRLLGVASLDSKAMATSFAPGRRLGFTVRARPTIRTDRNGDRTKSQELDAFSAATRGRPDTEIIDRGAVYQSWLATRLAAGGAAGEHIAIGAFARGFTLRRNRARDLRLLEGPDVTFTGILQVTDTDKFAALLARGVGRHTAFGYGMLLLKPA